MIWTVEGRLERAAQRESDRLQRPPVSRRNPEMPRSQGGVEIGVGWEAAVELVDRHPVQERPECAAGVLVAADRVEHRLGRALFDAEREELAPKRTLRHQPAKMRMLERVCATRACDFRKAVATVLDGPLGERGRLGETARNQRRLERQLVRQMLV